jgi:hypothetical protein
MKKILIFMFAFLLVSFSIQAQSVIKGVCTAATINGAGTANVTVPVSMQSEWDWSLQVIPSAGAVSTPDSTYATFKVFVSNSDGTAVWSEIVSKRDTLDNTTIALSPGLLIEGTDFQNVRMRLQINRPASLDTLTYTVYYAIKLPVQISK